MAKKQKAKKTSEKLKGMADALARMVAKPIQPQQPPQILQPSQQIQPPPQTQPAQPSQPAKQQTFRYHDRPKNFTKTFLVRMTPEAHDKLLRASYVTFRESSDIVREAINRHLAELEAEHQKKHGGRFPPIPPKP
jgi:hypothetical protein